MKSPRDILRKIVNDSGLTFREFAEKYGDWDAGYLSRALSGEKPIGTAVIGRLLVHVDEQTAAKLIRAHLEEQKALIEAERRRFAALLQKPAIASSSPPATRPK